MINLLSFFSVFSNLACGSNERMSTWKISGKFHQHHQHL